MVSTLCHNPFLNSSPSFGHHILPFLAPRAFVPWPKHLSKRKTHTAVRSIAATSQDRTQNGSIGGEAVTSTPSWRYIIPAQTVLENKLFRENKTTLLRLTRFDKDRLTPFQRRWTVPFAKLRDQLQQRIEGEVQQEEDVDVVGSIELNSTDDIERSRMLAEWRMLSIDQKLIRWPALMLRTLESDPESALDVLLETWYRPTQPRYALADCLDYLTSYQVLYQQHPDQSKIDRLFDGVMHMLKYSMPTNPLKGPSIHLSQRTIWLLAGHLNGDQLVEFYHVLVYTDNLVTTDTVLQLADRLARNRKTELALEALKRLASLDGDFTSPEVESACTTIFHAKNRQPDTKLSDFDIFSQFLDLGLQPNLIHYNVWLENMIRQGRSEIAWDIYNNFSTIGIQADESTYSILLNDAKKRMDHGAIERISDTLSAKHVNSPYIANDLLHYLFLMAYKAPNHKNPLKWKNALSRMLSLYNQVFHTKALSTLFPPRYQILTSSRQESASKKMSPTAETFAIMIVAFLHKSRRGELVVEFYNHFQSLISQGHPDAVAAAETGCVYDALIMALGRDKRTLHVCTEVVSNMIRYRPRAVSRPRSQAFSSISRSRGERTSDLPSAPHNGVHPTVRTWSILLFAFINNGQSRAAEKILDMMRSRGIEPNQVTWNSLAMGYARNQDVGGTISAIERLEAGGDEVDDWTMEALKTIRNRDKLILALEDKERKRVADDKERKRVDDKERKRDADDALLAEISDVLYLIKEEREALQRESLQRESLQREVLQREALLA